MKPSLSLENYYHSFRYLRTREILGRVLHRQMSRLYRVLPRLGMEGAIERACDLSTGMVAPSQTFQYPEAAGEVSGGYEGGRRFRFLEQTMSFPDGYDWLLAGTSLAWQFRLNYFDWAPRLAGEGRHEELCEQIESWIRQNPPGRMPSWHPYPTSLRIVNWIRALMVMGERHDCPSWTQSLSHQAAFVEANLEFHLGANHLIENAFALLVAGLFFRGTAARRWERKGLELLTAELDEQALPDGGHVERSVSYHLRVNQVCREALCLLQANQRPMPLTLHDVHERMSSFTESMRHCDGNLPLFHDAQWIEDAEWDRFLRLKTALV